MHSAILQFPGSNCDRDMLAALQAMEGVSAYLHWHKDADLSAVDAVVVPGGFSFGDYLRCGAIARFSPVMSALKAFADNGGPVLGVCNGFQILCEAGLLPGALVRNACLEFRCQLADLAVVQPDGPFGRASLGESLRLPIAHGEGNYRADETTLQQLEANGQILFRYAPPSGNPNGSLADIAGIRNNAGNVIGMMPHPERAVADFHPNTQGRVVLESFVDLARQRASATTVS
ncbi:MAG: phosphoribosylformylglycinamidine synthase subunit PurQ [Opitutales bacterium]